MDPLLNGLRTSKSMNEMFFGYHGSVREQALSALTAGARGAADSLNFGLYQAHDALVFGY